MKATLMQAVAQIAPMQEEGWLFSSAFISRPKFDPMSTSCWTTLEYELQVIDPRRKKKKNKKKGGTFLCSLCMC